MKWYLQLNQDNVITDAVDYAYPGYTEVELPDTYLPAGINGGWFTWNGITYIEDLTKKPISGDIRITALEETQTKVVDTLVTITGAAL